MPAHLAIEHQSLGYSFNHAHGFFHKPISDRIPERVQFDYDGFENIIKRFEPFRMRYRPLANFIHTLTPFKNLVSGTRLSHSP